MPSIDVYGANLDVLAAHLRPFWNEILASSELAHSIRFRADYLRQRFLARRGLLRLLLSARLGQEPRELDICADERGKPGLRDRPSELAFSVSNSGDWALVAIGSRCDRLGVDIERVQQPLDVEAVAAEALSESEVARLGNAEPSSRKAMLLALWTKKEAILKADGIGLLGPALPAVEVTFATDEIVPFGGWRVRQLADPIQGWIGALAWPCSITPSITTWYVGPSDGTPMATHPSQMMDSIRLPELDLSRKRTDYLALRTQR